MIITLELASKPGEPNINGFTYSKEAYDKMINSEKYKELKEKNCLFVTAVSGNRYCDKYSNLAGIIGRVIKINDDFTVDIDIDSKYVITLLENGFDISRHKLAMNYAYKKDVDDMYFINYFIVDEQYHEDPALVACIW